MFLLLIACAGSAGFNVCIFCYGQTGSGKTHTMAGSDVVSYEGRGINYRALDDLFALNEARRGEVRPPKPCVGLGLHASAPRGLPHCSVKWQLQCGAFDRMVSMSVLTHNMELVAC